MDEKITERAAQKLAAAGIAFKRDALLSGYTSFKIGGPADLAVFPADAEELKNAFRILKEDGIPLFVAGRGSNLLFDDAGFRGAVVFTTGIDRCSVSGTRLTAGCGCTLTAAARRARDSGLSGLEFAYGIPGTVGGGVFMNAGAYGGQISDVFARGTAIDPATGETVALEKEEMDFSYRHSSLAGRGLVAVETVFELQKDDRREIAARMNDFQSRRKEKQPLEYPSAGSVFKRPAPDVYVGKMIDDAGLKGTRVGGAEVSEKHAGFIVNRGGATSRDVRELIGIVQDRLESEFGIRPECEILTVPEIPEK